MWHWLDFRTKIRKNFTKSVFVFCCFSVFLSSSSAHAKLPSDPFLSEQWYLETLAIEQAWNETTGSTEVIVAVLDAGFDLDHPDLIGQYWRNTHEIAGNQKDDDNNGFEDDVFGWDFVDGDPDPTPGVTPGVDELFNDTVVSHGTVIAGIIGATTDNLEGIAGINHQVSIMPLRILDERGIGSTTAVRQAIVYAVRNGAQVINLSFTTDHFEQRLQETIEWAVDQGVVIVTAVGNGNRDINKKPTYPACYDLHAGRDLVLGVAASGREGRKADFSNFGSNCTDIVAPGTNIFGTVYHDPSRPITSTAYGSPWEGTSIAAPMVTGVAALLKARYPLLTPEQIHLSIKLSVDPVNETSVEARRGLGAGRVNAARALEVARVFAREGVRSVSRTREHSRSLVIAEARGSEPLVKRFDASGRELASFLAYKRTFRGGVSVAMGDVNGDGHEEIVTGARRGGGPQVRVFDLQGKIISQFFADNPSDRGGIFVGTADTNGDGIEEIFVTPERGGSGEVRVFNRFGQLQGIIRPFGRVSGTLSMAFGNMDDDHEDELIILWDENPLPVVRILDGNGLYLRDLQVSSALARGTIASADTDGDGKDEIVIASARSRAPLIEVYSPSGTQKTLFTAFTPSMVAGLNVCVGDIDQNGRAEIYTTPRTGGGPQIQMLDGNGLLLGSFFAFDRANRLGASCAIW